MLRLELPVSMIETWAERCDRKVDAFCRQGEILAHTLHSRLRVGKKETRKACEEQQLERVR